MKRRKFMTAAAILPTFSVSEMTFGQTLRSDRGIVVKAGESRFRELTVISGGSPNDIKVSGQDTEGNLSVFEYTGNSKGGPPLHYHHNQDEIFFILDGVYKFKVGGDLHELKKGDTIFLPRKVPHTFAQMTEKGRMYFIFQPSGKMEEFFRTISRLKAEPTPDEGAKIFADHDMVVVGPPLDF